jgi:hypothetical protein
MGQKARQTTTEGFSNPGPGSYQARSSFDGVKYKFGGRYDHSKSELQPGPGQYSTDYKIKPRQGYTMSGKFQSSSQKMHEPGPGAYNIGGQREKVYGKFGKETRKGMGGSREFAPGPGAYDARQRGSGPRFTMASKIGEGKAGTGGEIPGPGSYIYKGYIGNEGVKSSISGHRQTSKVASSQEIPGPGAYNVLASKPEAPAFK